MATDSRTTTGGKPADLIVHALASIAANALLALIAFGITRITGAPSWASWAVAVLVYFTGSGEDRIIRRVTKEIEKERRP